MKQTSIALLMLLVFSSDCYCDLIIVDFESSANGINTDTNWNVIVDSAISLTGLTTTDGDVTGVSFATTLSGALVGAPNAGSIPTANPELAFIDDSYVGNSVTGPRTIDIENLRPNEEYRVSVFGLQTASDINDSVGQFVQIAGSNSQTAFQDIGDPVGDLFLNVIQGSPTASLDDSYFNITSTSAGEITISLTADPFPSPGNSIFVAGFAIDGDFTPVDSAAIPEPSLFPVMLALFGFVVVYRIRKAQHGKHALEQL